MSRQSKKATTSRSPRHFAIILAKIGDEYYIQLDDDNNVVAYDSVSAGIHAFEREYNRNHYERGYEKSMSTCLNYIFFNRAFFGPLDDADDLRRKLLPDDAKTFEVFNLTHVSGYMSAIKADPKKAAEAWKKSVMPRLISND